MLYLIRTSFASIRKKVLFSFSFTVSSFPPAAKDMGYISFLKNSVRAFASLNLFVFIDPFSSKSETWQMLAWLWSRL